jgi:hypothetical protein
MKPTYLVAKSATLLMLISICIMNSVNAQDENSSPYFVVLSGEDEGAGCPLNQQKWILKFQVL